MGYEKFKTEIVKALSGFYGGNTEVELVEALRNNGKRRDAVRICVDGEDSSAVPAIYLEGFFRMYDAGDMDMEGCVKGITELRAASVCSPQIAQFSHGLLSWDAVREKVYPMLLSSQENREMLEKLVSRSLLDLSVIYIIRETADGGNSCSVKITRGMMEAYGISEGQLYRQAMRNLKGDGYRFFEIGAYIQGRINSGGNRDELEQRNVDGLEDGEMYILRNASGLYGAAGILNGELIQNTVKGHDCFILPSSIHETIFLPVSDDQNQRELDGMVAEINRMCVDEEERLADHSYYYDARAGEIRICA